MEKAARFVSAHIGHCSVCMRQSFFAASGLLISGLLANYLGQGAVASILNILAIAGFVLWSLHVTLFTYRSIPSSSVNETASLNRRAVMLRGMKLLGATVLISMSPKLAMADYQCCACSGSDRRCMTCRTGERCDAQCRNGNNAGVSCHPGSQGR